jgi:hypothetical protein
MSTDSSLIKVINITLGDTTRADETANETAKTGKVTAGVTVMSIFCRKICKAQSAPNPGNEKPSCLKAESAKFLEGNSRKTKDLSQKMRKGRISKKLAPRSKK